MSRELGEQIQIGSDKKMNKSKPSVLELEPEFICKVLPWNKAFSSPFGTAYLKWYHFTEAWWNACHPLFELSISLHILNRQPGSISTCGCWVANCLNTVQDVTGVFLFSSGKIRMCFNVLNTITYIQCVFLTSKKSCIRNCFSKASPPIIQMTW